MHRDLKPSNVKVTPAGVVKPPCGDCEVTGQARAGVMPEIASP